MFKSDDPESFDEIEPLSNPNSPTEHEIEELDDGQMSIIKSNPYASARGTQKQYKQCLSMCAVNKENRVQCRAENNPKLPYECKSRGCCYDNEEKACYRPAKNFCPRPRCEAVELSQREACPANDLNSCLKLAPGCCWDNKLGQCYKRAEVTCPATYKKVVKASEICGWRRISKPQCLAKKECCWNDQAGYCVHSVKNQTAILSNFINSQLNTGASKIEVVEKVAEPVTTPTAPSKVTQPKPTVTIPTYEQLEKNFDDVLSKYVNAQLGEPVQPKDQLRSLYPNSTHGCPMPEKLDQAELCGNTIDKDECEAQKCCLVTVYEDIKACFHPVTLDQIDDPPLSAGSNVEDGEHSIYGGQGPYYGGQGLYFASETTNFNRNGNYLPNTYSSNQPSENTNQPITYIQVPDKPRNEQEAKYMKSFNNQPTLNYNSQFDVILSNREAKTWCSQRFEDKKSKNYKKCVLYMMPNILEVLKEEEANIYNMPSDDMILKQQADQDLVNMLTSVCPNKMDSFDLCKAIALIGRPLKKDPTKSENPFNLDFVNLDDDNTPELMKQIFAISGGESASMDSNEILSLLLSQGGTGENSSNSVGIMLRKISAARSIESMETEIMIRLLTDVNSFEQTGAQVARGPSTDCYETLMVNSMMENYNQYSYFTSDAKDFENQFDCEDNGHCWIDFELDTIINETYGGTTKKEFTNLFAFSKQLDRILGPKPEGLFARKCIKKVSSVLKGISLLDSWMK